MRKVYAEKRDGKVIIIGISGEDFATKVLFQKEENASAILTVENADGQKYPVELHDEGQYLAWNVTRTDTFLSGYGRVEITYVLQDGTQKSVTYRTRVLESLTPPSGEVPDGLEDWYNRVITASINAIESAQVASEKAEEVSTNATVVAEDAETATNSANVAVESAESAQTSATEAGERLEAIVALKEEIDSAAQVVSEKTEYVETARNEAETFKEEALSASRSAQDASDSAEEAKESTAQIAQNAETSITKKRTEALNALDQKQTSATNSITEKTEEQLARIPEVSELSRDLAAYESRTSESIANIFGSNIVNDDGSICPVFIAKDSYVTTSTSDGSNLDTNNVVTLYDENKKVIQRFSAFVNNNSRTVKVNNDAYFAKIEKIDTPVKIKLEIGQHKTAYSDYVSMPVYEAIKNVISVNHTQSYDLFGIGEIENGGIDVNGYDYNGSGSYLNNHARTKNRIVVDAPVLISCKNEIQVKVCYYKDETSNVDVVSTNWDKELYIDCSSKKYIRIAFAGFNVAQNMQNVEIKTFNDLTRPKLIKKIRTDFNYKLGSLSNGSFIPQDWEPRIVCMDYVSISKFVSVYDENLDGYMYSFHVYDKYKKYIGSIGYARGVDAKSIIATYEDAFYVRFLVKKENGTITASDYANIHLYCSDVAESEVCIKNAIEIFRDTRCKTVCHTGYLTGNYPRNSYEGFLEACKSSIWGIETDLQVTSDGVILCLHDAYHGRLTSGTGVVSEMTYAEQYENVRLSFDYIGTPSEYRICKFEDYLNLCKVYGKIPVIELKPDTDVYQGRTLTVNYDYAKIAATLKEYGFTNNCIITSFDKDKLDNMREKNKDAILIFVSNNQMPSDDILELPFCRNGNGGVSVYPHTNLTKDYIKTLHKNGLIVMTGTATPENKTIDVFNVLNGADIAVCDLIEDILE